MLNQSYDAFRTSHPELSWLEDAPDMPMGVNPWPIGLEFFVGVSRPQPILLRRDQLGDPGGGPVLIGRPAPPRPRTAVASGARVAGSARVAKPKAALRLATDHHGESTTAP